MPIEINNQTNSPRLNTRESSSSQRTPAESAGKAQTAEATSINSDSVRLTGTAAMIQEIQSRIANLPVVDSGRVEAIKEALNNGTYQINPDSVAEKLMNFEAELSASL